MKPKLLIPDDLPTLTEVVGESTGEFPMLTEVVGEASGKFSAQADIFGEPPYIPLTPSEILAVPSNYVATPPAAEDPSTDTDQHDITAQLLQELTIHIESAFAAKLQRHLAEAQQQAVALALAELKNELPQLIRAALATPHDPA